MMAGVMHVDAMRKQRNLYPCATALPLSPELRIRRCSYTIGFGAPRRMMENRSKTAALISGAMAPPRARSFRDNGEAVRRAKILMK
jgi:hypothetical protein